MNTVIFKKKIHNHLKWYHKNFTFIVHDYILGIKLNTDL